MTKLFVVLVAVVLSGTGFAGDAGSPVAAENGASPTMLSFADLRWTELPERKGMEFAPLSGNPDDGAYTQMRRVPAGTDNGLHTHSSEIKNVIVSGVWYTGTDSASARDFGPGSVIVMPAKWVHVSGCRAGAACVFYQEGKGKFDFHPVGKATRGK